MNSRKCTVKKSKLRIDDVCTPQLSFEMSDGDIPGYLVCLIGIPVTEVIMIDFGTDRSFSQPKSS